jgi:cell division topological specificity factor MinE
MGFLRTSVAALLALLCASNGALGFTPPGARVTRYVAALAGRPRPTARAARGAVSMGVLRMFERMFSSEPQPKEMAVSRLNLMLASDRSALDQETLIKIRAGIIELVQQYVEIQADDVILNISTEERKSILTASLAIKGTRRIVPQAQPQMVSVAAMPEPVAFKTSAPSAAPDAPGDAPPPSD